MEVKSNNNDLSINKTIDLKSTNNFKSGEQNLFEDLPNEISTVENIHPDKRNRIFIFFLLANLFLNYDTGVIPASLIEINKEINLDFKEQALIGSLVYLGLSFASLFVSLIFNKWGPAKVCSFMLILNSLSCFIFSFSNIKYILFSCRFLMGITEAFVVIYGPVWVNNYSPPEHSAKWMGILHTFSALGVIAGYLVAGVTVNFFNKYLSWRFAIQLQGIFEIPIALYFFLEDENFINVDQQIEVENEANLDINKKNAKELEPKNNKEIIISKKSTNSLRKHRMDTIETSNLKIYCSQAIAVICNSLYICVAFGLCSMFFIVTGVQFWITSYLIDILGYNPIQVVIIYSTISITAPLSGILVGGTFADKYGGYKGKNTVKAIKLCCAFGVIAFVFAFPLGFLTSLIYISVLLWAFLFFGAAIVPVGTGIMVSSVRKDCQATSSSISQLIFNLMGYFFSPILVGFIMDNFSDKYEGYKWGMRVIFWWSIFAVIFMSLAWFVAYNKYKSGNKDEDDLMEEEMNQDMGDLIKLEIRRRMAQNSL